jgi:hypothetical protein
MICTIWQPAYTPPGYGHVPARERSMLATKQRVYNLLKARGITSKADIMKELGITISQLRHSMELLKDEVEFEHSGNGALRACSYWLKGTTPPIEKRCKTHRVHVWFQANPWRPARDIPSDIYTANGHKSACVWTLEMSGKLISRVQNGRKQYKAVI